MVVRPTRSALRSPRVSIVRVALVPSFAVTRARQSRSSPVRLENAMTVLLHRPGEPVLHLLQVRTGRITALGQGRGLGAQTVHVGRELLELVPLGHDAVSQ